jgi:hypothetical protein
VSLEAQFTPAYNLTTANWAPSTEKDAVKKGKKENAINEQRSHLREITGRQRHASWIWSTSRFCHDYRVLDVPVGHVGVLYIPLAINWFAALGLSSIGDWVLQD